MHLFFCHILQNLKKCNCLVVFNFGLLTHFENGTKFIDKIRDLFLNENEIKMKGRIESENIRKVPSFQ